MRWINRLPETGPEDGARRERTFFAWWPVRIWPSSRIWEHWLMEPRVVWLERVTVIEECCRYVCYSTGKSGWEWVPVEEVKS